jgi:hypothetical protein
MRNVRGSRLIGVIASLLGGSTALIASNRGQPWETLQTSVVDGDRGARWPSFSWPHLALPWATNVGLSLVVRPTSRIPHAGQ